MEKIEKEKKIKAEIKKIDSLLKDKDIKTKKSIRSLVENVAFMSISLDELQEIINEKGYTEEYQNGANQKGVKETAEVKIYNTMIKNHMSALKQLSELFPKGDNDKGDGFEDFVNSR